MAEPLLDQKLAAILAADVAGYSALMQDDERATIATTRIGRYSGNTSRQRAAGWWRLGGFISVSDMVDRRRMDNTVVT